MIRIIPSLLHSVVFLFLLTGISLGQIAIIVHPDNPLSSISREELEHFYNGSLTQFPDGTPVILVEHKPTAEIFYQTLLNKSYIKVKKQWIRYVFSGRTANPPEEISNTATLQKFVLANRGAIAFLPFDEINTNVKIIAVDEFQTKDDQYLFSKQKMVILQP